MGRIFLFAFALVLGGTFLAVDHFLAARSPDGRPSLVSRLAAPFGAPRPAPADPSAVAEIADRGTVGRLSDRACDTKAGTKFCGAGN
ncbi:MAG: hypothetical protein N2422_06150 [Rhodobacteraceae bacterium]|nr:hypothetical protein [Paracoccaceae bacterium]